MKKALIPILIFTVKCFIVTAQDIHFSQFYEIGSLRNPALMGLYEGDYKISALYRNQWSSISKPFQTGLINAETRIATGNESPDYFTIGLTSYYDKAGSIDLKTIAIYPSINYSKLLEDVHQSYISVGFTGGYIQRSFDANKMTFNNQYQNGLFNPNNPNGENITNSKLQNWDFGAGIAFSGKLGNENQNSYLIGVSGYHFTRAKNSFYATDNLIRMQMKWESQLSLMFKLQEHFKLTIHTNGSFQGKYHELISGFLLGWNNEISKNVANKLAIYTGVFYRFKDAFIPMLKVDYNNYCFALSYDYNNSSLHTATNGQGGAEFSITAKGLFKHLQNEKSRLSCPKFY